MTRQTFALFFLPLQIIRAVARALCHSGSLFFSTLYFVYLSLSLFLFSSLFNYDWYCRGVDTFSYRHGHFNGKTSTLFTSIRFELTRDLSMNREHPAVHLEKAQIRDKKNENKRTDALVSYLCTHSLDNEYLYFDRMSNAFSGFCTRR